MAALKLLVTLAIILLNLKLGATENFILINGQTGEIVKEMGTEVDMRVTPCSTFKIALSLMGFDANILYSEDDPQWPYQEGYMDDFEAWRMPQTPKSWMKTSCVWYSQLLTPMIGIEKIHNYLAQFQYGNQDMTGDPGKNNGLTRAWLSSSLKISPREQVSFLWKLLHAELPIKQYAMQATCNLLLLEELKTGWQLFGKTGLGKIFLDQQTLAIGWVVGAVLKNSVNTVKETA